MGQGGEAHACSIDALSSMSPRSSKQGVSLRFGTIFCAALFGVYTAPCAGAAAHFSSARLLGAEAFVLRGAAAQRARPNAIDVFAGATLDAPWTFGWERTPHDVPFGDIGSIK